MVAILGSTFDDSDEPVREIAAALAELLAGGGLDIQVHVDGPSGMIAPFLDPDLPWDFRLERARRSTPACGDLHRPAMAGHRGLDPDRSWFS